eukprot:symbB.v1.2.035298.t1/scaffold4717.1/size35950/1
MNVPLATAAAVPGQFAVLVPNGVSPGQMIQTRTPDGQQVQVTVPAGCPPGSQFMVSYQPAPVAAAVPVAAPMQHAMAMPVAPAGGLHYWPGAADPFAILNTLAGVSIKQQINWAEVLVGWDQPEKCFWLNLTNLKFEAMEGLGDHLFVQLMSNFPPAVPAALARQHAMAHQRGVRGRDQDETASQSGSVSSWDQVGEDEPVQADANRLGSIPEGSAAVPKAPPPPAAPVTQAAHGLLNYENEPAHQRKLRKQQERAQRRGYRNARSGQMGGVHNAANLQLPPHLSQVGAGEGERSVMLLDSRDHRMQSPFQGWLLDEILMNARSYVSVLSDRQLIRSPSDGYHFSLFYMKTLSNMKLVVV